MPKNVSAYDVVMSILLWIICITSTSILEDLGWKTGIVFWIVAFMFGYNLRGKQKNED